MAAMIDDPPAALPRWRRARGTGRADPDGRRPPTIHGSDSPAGLRAVLMGCLQDRTPAARYDLSPGRARCAAPCRCRSPAARRSSGCPCRSRGGAARRCGVTVTPRGAENAGCFPRERLQCDPSGNIGSVTPSTAKKTASPIGRATKATVWPHKKTLAPRHRQNKSCVARGPPSRPHWNNIAYTASGKARDCRSKLFLPLRLGEPGQIQVVTFTVRQSRVPGRQDDGHAWHLPTDNFGQFEAGHPRHRVVRYHQIYGAIRP